MPASTAELWSEQDVVCLKSDDPARPWKLRWALTEQAYNNDEIFLCVHERASEFHPTIDPEAVATVYARVGDRFKLLTRLDGGGLSYFLRPKLVWLPIGRDDRECLVQITAIAYGTGVLTEEHVFRVNPHRDSPAQAVMKIEPVEFISASDSYQPQLHEGEAVMKGVGSRLTEDGLFFEFFIWNDADANSHPTAGKVTGTYKLERMENDRLRISAATFKREPVSRDD